MSVLPVPEHRAGEQRGLLRGPSLRQRPTLIALPRVRRRQKGLTAAVILLLTIALGLVLAINIHVANSQYAVVQMQNEHRSLVQQNQALTQQVQFQESPQSLSNSAVTLGMVMPAAAATVDLSTGEVHGSAELAETSQRPSNFVDAPVIPGDDLTAAHDVAEHVVDSPVGLLGAGALHTLIQSSAGQNGAGESGPSSSSESELNGGTIPAPSLTE